MTPSELKYHVTETGSHFFDRESMKFFGDTMANYGVRDSIIETWTDPEPVEVWELYRKRPVKLGNRESAYFDKVTFTKRGAKK